MAVFLRAKHEKSLFYIHPSTVSHVKNTYSLKCGIKFWNNRYLQKNYLVLDTRENIELELL